MYVSCVRREFEAFMLNATSTIWAILRRLGRGLDVRVGGFRCGPRLERAEGASDDKIALHDLICMTWYQYTVHA